MLKSRNFNNVGILTRSGITLIEVVVGLAMLTSILSVLLTSLGKFDRIAKVASEKSEAVRALDELLGKLHREGFPMESKYTAFDENTEWMWIVERKPWSEAPLLFDIGKVSIRKGTNAESIVLAQAELLLKK